MLKRKIVIYIIILVGLTAFTASVSAQENRINRTYVCRVDDSGWDVSLKFKIIVQPEGRFLSKGIYITFNRPPWQGNTIRFKVRSGEASALALINRIYNKNAIEETTGQPMGLSFDGIHFSAVGIDLKTSDSLRGDQVLILEQTQLVIGDSFNTEDDYGVGKYVSGQLRSCD